MSPFWKGTAPPRVPSATRRLQETEKRFRQNVVALARLRGWAVYWTWMSLHSPAGFPDLCCVRPPRIVFAELKTDTGRVTAAQQEWLSLLGACPGCEAYVWRPSTWSDVDAMLQ